LGRQRPSKRIAGAINDEDHRILVMSATAFGLVATGDSGQPDALAVEVGSAAFEVSVAAALMRGVCHLCDIRHAPNQVHQGQLMDAEATSPTPEPSEVGRTTVLTLDEQPHPTRYGPSSCRSR
jgi:hypothetical protein